MHKRIKVADLELDETTGTIRKIHTVYAPEHLPVGVRFKKGMADRAALNEWWSDRSIPASRSGIHDALETLHLASPKLLLTKCFGLSLSDQYWICPAGSDLSWDQINFFDHEFSEDIGDILFGAKNKPNPFNFSSPDSTSDGNLKKKWKVIDGRRFLVKGGSNPFRQQPLNEVIAAKILERLDVPYVNYAVIWSQGAPYSICEDFITRDTDLVPAWRIFQTQKKSNSTSVYQHFLECCEELGLQDAVPFLDRMIVLDYIIANEDRHLNNFGGLRDADTLEWIGFSPIYDSGSSLGYDKLPSQIRSGRDIECKPFKKHHEEQLKLVSDFSWIDFERLKDVRQLIISVLSAEEAKDYIDEHRIMAIADSVESRIQRLEHLAMKQGYGSSQISQMDCANDDVEENTARSYSDL